MIKQNRIGETRLTTYGLKATVIDYINAHKVTIRFENGVEKVTTWERFNSGRITPVFVTDFQFCVQRHIGIIKPKLYLKDFIYYCLKSPVCKKQADFVAWGVAVKTVPIKELRKFIIKIKHLRIKNFI